MPVYQSVRGAAPAILTKDQERIVAYTLSPEGARQLRSAGVRSGATIPARILASLIRSGHAHSPHPAEAAGQVRFDFSRDETADLLPRCEFTGSSSDIHLVVYGEANGTVAKLLSREPRFLLQKVTTLSIPVTVLTSTTLAILESSGKIPPDSAGAARVRDWLRQDLDDAWEKLRQSQAQHQTDLLLDSTPDQLPFAG